MLIRILILILIIILILILVLILTLIHTVQFSVSSFSGAYRDVNRKFVQVASIRGQLHYQ